MKYRIVFRPLTELSNQWARRKDEHLKGAEESHEIVVDAANENHAMHIFMSMVQHAGIKVAQYRIENLNQNNDPIKQNRNLPFV